MTYDLASSGLTEQEQTAMREAVRIAAQMWVRIYDARTPEPVSSVALKNAAGMFLDLFLDLSADVAAEEADAPTGAE